jgi:hypothetical protein
MVNGGGSVRAPTSPTCGTISRTNVRGSASNNPTGSSGCGAAVEPSIAAARTTDRNSRRRQRSQSSDGLDRNPAARRRLCFVEVVHGDLDRASGAGMASSSGDGSAQQEHRRRRSTRLSVRHSRDELPLSTHVGLAPPPYM